MSRPASAAKGGSGSVQTTNRPKVRIHIIYYSTYGHVARMAQAVKKGVESVGAEAKLIQVPETLPREILETMNAPEPDKSIPTITFGKNGENTINVEEALTDCDGILLGYPTRFGTMPSQVKTVWDATTGLWLRGALIGKPIGVFFATGTQGGGQESTTLTSLTNFIHHGMIFVPLGYSCPFLVNMDEIHGGSGYGAGTFSGSDGSRQPSDIELKIAEHQGVHFTQTATALKIGRAALPPKDANPPEPNPKEVQPKVDRPSSSKPKENETKTDRPPSSKPAK